MDAAPPATFPDSLRGKRILLCTESYGPVNGVSRTTQMLVNHLRANGADVAVVAPHTRETTFVSKAPPTTPDSTTSPKPGADRNIDIRIRGFPLPYNPELSVVYPVRLSKLYRRTFGAPPDLIYLASPASLGFQVMMQLRQHPPANQIPILCNFQTDLAGYCAILFPPPFSSLAVLAFARVQSFLFNHPSVQTIFYPSRFVRRYLEAQRVHPSKLQILQRGVDTALFHPSKRSAALRAQISPDGEIILVCVSRLAGEKGFDFLARAAHALHARGVRFRLYIVGGNRNAAVEGEIKDLFAPLTAQGRVVFAGFLVGEALATAYASADVFLHCSVTETFGLVVLESMASGVPVVARDEGGPSDTVRDGETGYLTPPGDLEAFVERVVVLAGDGPLRERMGRDARRQAEEATWERINNRVAWRMAEAIGEREKERKGLLGKGKVVTTEEGEEGELVAQRTAGFVETVVAKAKSVRGMAAISATWVAVGMYLIVIKVGLWVKSRVRQVSPGPMIT
jgi:glycosyltransferase involved in cell wall biosynthesis